MPEFAPQRFSSKKQRRHRKWPTKGPGFCLVICLVICLIMVVVSGCDDGDTYERDEALVAEEHAQARASYLAQQVVVESRDWVLLHPSSEKQG